MRPDVDADRLLTEAQAAPDVIIAVEAALQTLIGHKLFTVMALDRARNEAARIYSSDPIAYPVRGRKPLGEMTGWGEHVITGRKAWIGRDAADLRWAFPDHEVIARLGCASCLNVPIIEGGAVIGTVNLLHEEAFYAEADVNAARPFAAVLSQAIRAWR